MQKDNNKSAEELLKEAREYLTVTRAKQEVLVAEWAKHIKQIPKELLSEIDLPEDITLYSVIPELYKDEPDENVYEEQYNAFMKQVEKINKIAMKANEDAKQCLLKHQQLTSNKV